MDFVKSSQLIASHDSINDGELIASWAQYTLCYCSRTYLEEHELKISESTLINDNATSTNELHAVVPKSASPVSCDNYLVPALQLSGCVFSTGIECKCWFFK